LRSRKKRKTGQKKRNMMRKKRRKFKIHQNLRGNPRLVALGDLPSR
jgi:hypothetical protein